MNARSGKYRRTARARKTKVERRTAAVDFAAALA
jgi:hypothetical protein